MANASGNHLNEEFVLLRFAGEKLLPFPVMLVVGDDAFTRNGIL